MGCHAKLPALHPPPPPRPHPRSVLPTKQHVLFPSNPTKSGNQKCGDHFCKTMLLTLSVDH